MVGGRGGARGGGYLPTVLLVLGCSTPTASFSTWYIMFLTCRGGGERGEDREGRGRGEGERG